MKVWIIYKCIDADYEYVVQVAKEDDIQEVLKRSFPEGVENFFQEDETRVDFDAGTGIFDKAHYFAEKWEVK